MSRTDDPFGVEVGDFLAAVHGVSCSGLTLEEVSQLIETRGGTPTILFARNPESMILGGGVGGVPCHTHGTADMGARPYAEVLL